MEKIVLPRFLLLLLLVLESGLVLQPTWITVSLMRGQGTALIGSVAERQPWRVVISCAPPGPTVALSLDGEDGLSEMRMIDCDGQARVVAVEPARSGSVYVALTSEASGEAWQVMVQEPLQW